jgi:hypothetical protein
MPNWCNNTVEITHDDPAMIERAREGFNGQGLFGALIPIPESLHIVAGQVGDPVEQEQLKAAEESNLKAHGYANWYDFCVNEWGTKWDVRSEVCDPEDIPGGLILTFDSAWSPPLAAYGKLIDMGFRIRALYYEPGLSFAGIWEDGDDDYYDYGGMTSEQIAEELPVELDEAFGISEQVAEYEAENQEIELNEGIDSINE